MRGTPATDEAMPAMQPANALASWASENDVDDASTKAVPAPMTPPVA